MPIINVPFDATSTLPPEQVKSYYQLLHTFGSRSEYYFEPDQEVFFAVNEFRVSQGVVFFETDTQGQYYAHSMDKRFDGKLIELLCSIRLEPV